MSALPARDDPFLATPSRDHPLPVPRSFSTQPDRRLTVSRRPPACAIPSRGRSIPTAPTTPPKPNAARAPTNYCRRTSTRPAFAACDCRVRLVVTGWNPGSIPRATRGWRVRPGPRWWRGMWRWYRQTPEPP